MSNGADTLPRLVPQNLRDKHALATRRALIRSARRLIARKGYQATGVDQIAGDAGATRGAFYHHFESKRELLIAILDEMLAALAQRMVEAAAAETDPLQKLRAALTMFLDACTEPTHARIVLKEAPAALGSDSWRELDARHFKSVTVTALRYLIDAGHMRAVPPEVLSQLLMAMLTESALLLVEDKTRIKRAEVDAVLDALLSGLSPNHNGAI